MKQEFESKKGYKFLIGIFLLASLIIFTSNFVSADIYNACNLEVSLINQDPYPTAPNSYVNIVFQVSGVQNQECDGARFELIPAYPFSLDENNSLKILQGATYVSENKNEWMIPYKLRVDKDALDGNNSIEVRYNYGKSNPDSYYIKKFNIEIKDSRTAFDAVIQETSGNDVSIAIANTGKYTANSVVVRIPEQEFFMVSGTDGQMVGNLESGDYTIVGFSISPKMHTNFQNVSKGNFRNDTSGFQTKLNFDIYYTDNLGERRIVNMELPLNLAGNFSLQGGNFVGIRRNENTQNNSSFWSKWYVWMIVLIVALLGYGFYNKYQRRIKALISHKKDSSEKIPDWVRNAKEKEKKK
jgi:hypothetical protein